MNNQTFEMDMRYLDCKLCNKFTKVGLNDFVKTDEVYYKSRFLDYDNETGDVIVREFRTETPVTLNYLDLVRVVIMLGRPDKNGRVTYVLKDILKVVQPFEPAKKDAK